MAGSISCSALSNGVVPVTGSGLTGSTVALAAHYTSTDGRYRTCSMYIAPVTAGAISFNIPQPFTGGAVVVKVADPTVGTVAATSSSQAV